jgi:hypothetical protein
MIKSSFYLFFCILIATSLVILQETMSNLVWLLSVNMPVTFGVFIATYFDNLFMMNGGGEVPLVALVAIGMSFASGSRSVNQLPTVWLGLQQY